MKSDIKHVEAAFDVAFTGAWLLVVLRWEALLRWLDAIGFPQGIPMPSADVVAQYRAWLIAVALIGIVVSLAKLTRQNWGAPLTAGHTIHQLANGYVTIAMLNSPNLLRPENITTWASWGDASAAEVQVTIAGVAALIGVLTAVGIAIDIVARWVWILRNRPAS